MRGTDDWQGEIEMKAMATFAAGCFWGVQESFQSSQGIIKTIVGYTGSLINSSSSNILPPSYQEVCTGRTGHAEAIQIFYNPSQISYSDLLKIFWACHDPTQLNRQGPDVGSQYRSVIFYHTEEQKLEALDSKTKLQLIIKEPIVTSIEPVGIFYPAEEYHQNYLHKNNLSSCKY